MAKQILLKPFCLSKMHSDFTENLLVEELGQNRYTPFLKRQNLFVKRNTLERCLGTFMYIRSFPGLQNVYLRLNLKGKPVYDHLFNKNSLSSGTDPKLIFAYRFLLKKLNGS